MKVQPKSASDYKGGDAGLFEPAGEEAARRSGHLAPLTHAHGVDRWS